MATLERRYYDLVDETAEIALDSLADGSTNDVLEAITWAIDEIMQYYENAGIMYGFLLGYNWKNTIHACQKQFDEDVTKKVESRL